MLLARLDALNAQGRMTALGRDMARLPVHPRLAHMLLNARSLDAVRARRAARGVAVRARPAAPGRRSRAARSGYPHAPGVAARRVRRRGRGSTPARARAAQRSRARGGRACAAGRSAGHGRKPAPTAELAGALLALAFPDRIGQRREGSEGRYLLANGRGAAFAGAVRWRARSSSSRWSSTIASARRASTWPRR